MQTFNSQIATAKALNTSFKSAFVPLKNQYLFSITAIITGTPTGILSLEVSNDPETNTTQPLVVPLNWSQYSQSSVTVVAAGIGQWRVTDVSYNYVRVSYTDTSGGMSTAKLDLIVNGKGV